MLSAAEKKSAQVYRWLLAYIDEKQVFWKSTTALGKCTLPKAGRQPGNDSSCH